MIEFLFDLWPLWIAISVLLGFFTYQNNRKAKNLITTDRVLLVLEIPRANEKKELAAEQMLASLHGILRSKKELVREGIMQEHISFEVAAIHKHIKFYVSVPKHLQNFVEGQIYAQYPTVQIYEVPEDYAARQLNHEVVYGAEVDLTENEALPIKTFQSFEVDPLAAMTATLAKLEEENEELWVQILARPIDDSWHKRSSAFVKRIKNGHTIFDGSLAIFGLIGRFLSALLAPPEESGSQVKELSERDKSRVTAIEEKSRKLGYRVKIRIAYLGDDKNTARLRMQAMIGTLKQFNTTNLNGFKQKKTTYSPDFLAEYRARHFIDHGFILNIEELASLYHLPHTNVETPNIVWASSKTAEPPSNLPAVGTVPPLELSPFGTTNFRGTNTQFGVKRSDRGRHIYIIGQTGTGKSGLLQLLTLSDVYAGEGFAVVDPHGDYAQAILSYIPANRVEDVIYFNPADTEYPMAFNPMEVTDPSFKNHISSELVGVLKRMFESWGPRLEYILRYTILALLDYPDSTMLDITRMLTEKGFRNEVIKHVTDPVVKNFWTVEFASWNDKFASEAVAPVLNKVGAFTANPMVRNIIGQPKSSMSIRHAMDNGKIIIVNLSRGLVGEDNAAIMGALMVTKIQLAAMSRANIANLSDRRPFYLYVDEFQNFATDSFATILSEARKYGLNLTVANQYISQMGDVVRDAVFGNVGAIVSFRVGADDAYVLQKYFEPQFESSDLIQLHNRHLVAAMSIDGEKAPAFSATTLNIPPPQHDLSAQIIENSRMRYSRPKQEVEQEIYIANEAKFEHKSNSFNQQKSHGKQHSQKTSGGPQKSSGKKSGSNKKSGKQNQHNAKQSQNKPNKHVQANDGTLDKDQTIKLH